jgi:6-phosphogluconolactonase
VQLEVLPDPEALALRAAGIISAHARAAVAAYGRFLLAVSGGSTPLRTFELLAGDDVPWDRVHVFQVDERVAPAAHPDRNLAGLERALLARVPIPRAQIHPMPVEGADLAAAAARYEGELRAATGPRGALDLVQLGLGADGHTASLFPGDPALDTGAEVAMAGPHQGRRRMTLTLPALDRAQRILWLVAGAEKADALARLRSGDRAIPGARVRRDRALLLADAAAAGASR